MSIRPPHEPLTHSDDVARVLRDNPPTLDEMSQARLERAVLAGAVLADAGTASAPSVSPSGSGARSRVVLGAVGAVLVAAAVLLFWLRPSDATLPVARFEVLESQASARRGTLEAGSVLPTGPSEEANIEVGNSRVHIASSSRVRIAALSATQLDLSLSEGEVRVEFHPRERGREHLTVETDEARVEVVGTVFRVRAGAGVTEVSVEEGVVRVVPRRGAASEVRAGEHLRVGDPVVSAEPSSPSAEADPVAREPRAEPADSLVVAPPSDSNAPAIRPRPTPEAPRDVLARAQSLVLEGDTAAATPLLERLTRQAPRQVQAQAWTLLADLAQRDGRLLAAVRAFSRAAELGQGTPTGPNALYALARLHERRGDATAAVRSYMHYLHVAPSGPLALQARQALCRLGRDSWCAP
ncbi:MAG: FecR domain-containing protein [Sandaracinaceae bacterium]